MFTVGEYPSTWLWQAAQDARYGLRTMRRNPAFTTVVVVTLALAIGMSTAVFTVVNTVLLRPLDYPDASRLVWITDYDFLYEHRDNYVSRAAFLSWREQVKSFERVVAYGNQDLPVMANGESSQERIASVTIGFWSITGASVFRGRLFHAEERDVMVISHAMFERRFGANPGIVGKIVTINGRPLTIAGVLAPGFRFLFPQQFVNGDEVRDIDAYIPFPESAMRLPERAGRNWDEVTQSIGPATYNVRVVAKVKAGVTIEQAQSEMTSVYARALQEYPDFKKRFVRMNFSPLQEKLVGETKRALSVLSACAGFVLLIAAVNIANLLLARSSTRRREMAVRASIGAGRFRVARQLLAESVLLALAGGVAGLLLAQWMLALLVRFGSHAVPRLEAAALDTRVLTFSFALSLLTGLLFGLAPALAVWRQDLQSGLKADLRTSSASAGHLRIRQILVGGQLALAVLLLAGAGLMLKSFWRMNVTPPGFAPENILTMRVPLSGPQYAAWPAKAAYIEELLRRISRAPGVQAAGVTGITMNIPVKVEGEKDQTAAVRMVSAGYLRAMGVPLVQGRWPGDGESLGAVLVNQSFARRMDGGAVTGRSIGGSFLRGTIVGVVADFKHRQLDAEATPEVYYPYELSPITRSIKLFIRTSWPATAAATSLRKLASEIDVTQPVYEVQSLEQALSDSVAPRRFNLFLLSAFATTALAMALVGVYGVIAFAVAQHTHEIGIRLALGAQRKRIITSIVGQAMSITFFGIAAGVASALALTRVLASLLYGVQPHDGATFAAVVAVLTLAALVACALPALRAARIDPAIALRRD